jgi:hypothetical protein
MVRGLGVSYWRKQVAVVIFLIGSWHTLGAETEKEDGSREVERWMFEGTLGALRDPYDSVKLLALQKMAELKAPQTATAIGEFLGPSYSRELRIAALWTYAALGVPDRNLLPQIVELLRDPKESVREAAVTVVGASGEATKAYLPQIVELFKDPDESVREAAVHAFGTTGEAAKAYLPQIVELFRDPKESVREAAVSAIGAIGGAAKAYLPQIVELLKDSVFASRCDYLDFAQPFSHPGKYLYTAYNVRQGFPGYQEKCSDIGGLVIRSALPNLCKYLMMNNLEARGVEPNPCNS